MTLSAVATMKGSIHHVSDYTISLPTLPRQILKPDGLFVYVAGRSVLPRLKSMIDFSCTEIMGLCSEPSQKLFSKVIEVQAFHKEFIVV